MPGRYTTALRGVLRPSEEIELLSLCTVDPNGMDPDIRDAVLSSYPGHPDAYTACHNIGAILFPILSSDGGLTSEDALGAAAAAAAIRLGNRVIRVDYGFHTFTIVADGDSIESIEGWAGSAPGSDGVIVFPLHECVDSDADYIRPTRGDAATAMELILDANYATRNTSVNTVSRGGRGGEHGIRAFEGEAGVQHLRVTVGALDTTVNIGQKMRARVDITKDWVRGTRTASTSRIVCWECLKIHGTADSSFIGRWHRCRACARTYCNQCGSRLERPVMVTRERTCGCGGRTQLVN